MIEAIVLLRSLDFAGFLQLFWFFVLFEIPRYTLATLAVGWRNAFPDATILPDPRTPVSVLLVGHNEGDTLRKAVAGLREQTHGTIQIVVVDDGSVDDMAEVGRQLHQTGRIDRFVSTGIRGGKASALHLGLRFCRHEYVVVMDIDTSLDRDAIAEIVAPLVTDPEVGAVSGNLAVRNPQSSLLGTLQYLEYATNISLGRQFTGMFGILMIVSGAFGAFRKSAIDDVGGWDVGPGDDSNLTTKLRRAGWSIDFAADAWGLTDVPYQLTPLVRQRTRWSRSLIRNRLRKFSAVFDPRQANFSLRDLVGTAALLWFDFGLSLAFLVYVASLFVQFGEGAFTILIAVNIVAIIGDTFELLVAAIFLPRLRVLRRLPYVPVYSLYISYLQRAIRLRAYFLELAFRVSYNDPFYPAKVREAQDQF
jgi:cellulose synthase/poly-beta-1,6-N-acetylglucosamine synthase-like glycosyltransferase